MSKELLAKLEGLQDDLSGYVAKSQDDKKAHDDVLAETKQNIVETGDQIQRLEDELKEVKQMQASNVDLDSKTKSLGEQLIASEEYASFTEKSDRNMSMTLETKAVTSAASSAGTLINPMSRGLITEPFADESLRNYLNVLPTSTNAVEWVRENVFTNSAAPVAESAQKPESDLTFTKESTVLNTIAHWIQISRQAADDGGQLMSVIDTKMREGLRDVENDQILTGNGTGENLNGILTQATAATLVQTANADRVAEAMLTVSNSGYSASAIVMNPLDWFKFQIQKDGDSRYMFGGPQSVGTKVLWGLPVVTNQKIPAGTFLIGALRRAVDLYDRMAVEVRLSDQDRDNFVKNMLTLRVEERIGLALLRPAAIVKGTFSA